jgi:hypothetical protein
MSDAGSGVPDDGGTSPDAGGALDDAGSAAPDVAVFAACPASPTVGDFPLDVAAVVHDKCQKCHKRPLPNHIPFPLFSYEDTLVPDPIPPYQGLPVWQVMHFVIQPNGVPHMPLGSAPQLTAAEFQTLDTWLSACATPVAEGTGGDVGEDAGMAGSNEGGADATGSDAASE